MAVLLQDDLDSLCKDMEGLLGDDQEWFDDDFGLGSAPLPHKPPPPYPGSPDVQG